MRRSEFMKRYSGWIKLIIFIALCAAIIFFTLQITAEYPALGEQVSYPVNQIEGFELTIEEPSWSPFKGYTIRWKVSADSEEVYFFVEDGNGYEYGGFEYLERLVDEQWYRLGYSQEHFAPLSLDFALGGNEAHGLEGSLVQILCGMQRI